MWRPHTAMILAAGLGTRMAPLTDSVPKPMVPLGGRPLVDHVLDRLASAEVRRAVVNVHYLADQLEIHLRGRTRPEIIISDERALLLDTGGGVKNALGLLGDDAFYVHNSDSVWIENGQSNLERLCAYWDAERMDALLMLADAGKSIGYDGRGDFDMLPDGRLRRRRADETVAHVFAGVSIAHPCLFDDSPAGAFSLNPLWDRAMEKGRLYGVALEGTWMHVGTPEALAEAERCLSSAAVHG